MQPHSARSVPRPTPRDPSLFFNVDIQISASSTLVLPSARRYTVLFLPPSRAVIHRYKSVSPTRLSSLVLVASSIQASIRSRIDPLSIHHDCTRHCTRLEPRERSIQSLSNRDRVQPDDHPRSRSRGRCQRIGEKCPESRSVNTDPR